MTLNTLALGGGEPLLSPETARNWLQAEHGLTERDDQMALPQNASSLAYAALYIAQGTVPAKLSDTYSLLSDGRGALSANVVAALGQEVANLFEEA